MTTGEYRERLRCPWHWYAVGLIGAVVLAAEVAFVAPYAPWWAVYSVAVVAVVAIVAWIGHDVVVVRGGVLLVHGARLETRYVATVIPLDAATMRRLMGRDADPAAFLATKPWVGSGVQILLDDPEDPVPYWAVSSRRPRELAAALAIRHQPSPGATS